MVFAEHGLVDTILSRAAIRGGRVPSGHLYLSEKEDRGESSGQDHTARENRLTEVKS